MISLRSKVSKKLQQSDIVKVVHSLTVSYVRLSLLEKTDFEDERRL